MREGVYEISLAARDEVMKLCAGFGRGKCAWEGDICGLLLA